MSSVTTNVVYVVGAGLSAGLGFPTISNLLPKMWPRLADADLDADLSKIIRFHHPSFHPARKGTYPNIEQLLSEMEANAQLFDSSRPATGNFTSAALEKQRQAFLLELADWFHELQAKALSNPPSWFVTLVRTIKKEKAQVVSFNWDLALDEKIFGTKITKASYGFEKKRSGPRLIKPHGSLNWYEHNTGRYLSDSKKISLGGNGAEEVFAFTEYRAPKSSKRRYMPLIVPPVYFKQFHGELFKHLWQQTVSVVSTASEVRFLGYSLPDADIAARFIFRCGFDNQEHGELRADGKRAAATGRARVIVVDPASPGPGRIEDAVGWTCEWQKCTVAEWIGHGGLDQVKT